MEEHHKNISSVHIEKHVSNPVNAFIVTKAMHDMINKTTHLTDAVSKKNTEGKLLIKIISSVQIIVGFLIQNSN